MIVETKEASQFRNLNQILTKFCPKVKVLPKSEVLLTSWEYFAHWVECAVEIPNLRGQPKNIGI